MLSCGVENDIAIPFERLDPDLIAEFAWQLFEHSTCNSCHKCENRAAYLDVLQDEGTEKKLKSHLQFNTFQRGIKSFRTISGGN